MLRASAASICPRCEVRSLFSATHPITNPASWQQSRFASKLSKRPSRMTLSKNVGRSGPRFTKPKSRGSWNAAPVAPSRQPAEDDPFGRSSRTTSPRDSNSSRNPRQSSTDKEPFGRDGSQFSRAPRQESAGRKSFGRDDSQFSRTPRQEGDARKPFGRDDSQFSRAPRRESSGREPFGRDESQFSRAPRQEGDARKPFGRDGSKFSRGPRQEGAARKPFGRDDSKFSRGPRRDSAGQRPFQREASFGKGSRDDDRKPRFRRDDDSPGHLNRTAAPRDLVPPQRSRHRRDAPSDSDSRTNSAATFRRDSGPMPRGNFSTQRGKGKEHFHALKMQRTLEPVSYNRRSSIKERISELDDFQYFDLLHEVQQSIPTQGLPGVANVQPTPAQRVAIPALLGMDRKPTSGMEQFLLAAETGSGKTLAYMVPVIDAIKRAELKEKEAEQAQEEKEEKKGAKMFQLEPPPLSGEENPNVARPRAIILVPSAELVQQVGAVAKSFAHTVKYRAALVSAAFSPTRIRNTLFAPQGVDVVVSTPHLLASIGESDPNIFSRVTHLVVDEADSLLDRSFSPLTTQIIDKSTPSLKQLIFCSATIPNSMDGYLRKHYPDVQRLVTPNIHAIPRRVQMAVVNVSQDPYRGNKDLACAETIHQISKSQVEHWDEERETVPTKRILVFVNEREKAVEVAEYLCKKGFDATALNRDTSMERQAQVLAEFGSGLYIDKRETSKREREAPPPAKPTKFPNTKVLVATDLGSRGIDTTAVRHVILYDVPHTTIDFIHRIGRTGRMGRRGRAIVLLGKGDRADVVKEVRETMFKGQALI